MQSQLATVYLSSPDAAKPAAAPSSGIALGGRVDHIVASGEVKLEQPGRNGTGDKLVYTAVDRTFVLSGSGSEPPRVVDPTRGTVTGASLRFHSGDDSVEVLSGEGGGKVQTVTRMKQKD